MKFTRYLLLFHFSRADRAVQIWMHFADNVDESKNHLPAWHMGSCKLGRETDVSRQEEGRRSTNCTQQFGNMDAGGTHQHVQVREAESGRVLDTETVTQIGREAKIEYGSVVLMEHVQAEGEGVCTGSALGEMKSLCVDSLRMRMSTRVTASKHTACSEGLRRCGVASDMGEAHVRGDMTMVLGEGSVKNHSMSRGQEGSSPASAFSFVRPCVQDRDPILS